MLNSNYALISRMGLTIHEYDSMMPQVSSRVAAGVVFGPPQLNLEWYSAATM